MRLAREPVTGANLAALGDDEIKDNLKSWSKRAENCVSEGERQRASVVVSHIKVEQEWRERLNAVGCPFLQDAGTCRQELVVTRSGPQHVCPKLSGGACTKRKFELASSLMRPAG